MDERLRQLVVKALTECGHVGGCVEWGERKAATAQRDCDLTPDAIRQFTIDHVRDGGRVDQRTDKRPEYGDYYYRVVIPGIEGMPRGLFVEMVLVDEDEDLPEVLLVSAHRQN